MASLLIRGPQDSDKKGMIAIYESEGFFDYAPSRPKLEVITATVDAYFEEAISDPAAIILYIADLDHRVAGFSIARKGAQSIWEVQAGVHFNHRKQGMGHALLAALFQEMHKRGPAECKAIVHAGNVASFKMESHFFREHGVTGLPGFLQFSTAW